MKAGSQRGRQAGGKGVRCIAGVLLVAAVVNAAAADIVQRNPFDPHRQPWPEPPAPAAVLPALTAQDLQVEAIFSFGALRGIVAQLDGKLKGALPASAAGKVRISLGQSFGEGYVLESVDSNQVVVTGGAARYTIPLLRKTNRGAAPAPAIAAASQAIMSTAPLMAAAPTGIEGGGAAPMAAAPAEAAPPTAAALPPPEPQPAAAPAPAPEPAPAQAAAATTAAPQKSGQPMTLLDAIRAAQAAARNAQNAAPPPANPFAAPRN